MYLNKAMFADLNCKTFGLSYGQTKAKAIMNSAGWFSAYGEKLGYGDISYDDLESISSSLAGGECFVVLSEQATLWDMPAELDKMNPGPDYVKSKGRWFVTRNDGVFKVDDKFPISEVDTGDNLTYTKACRAAVLDYVRNYFPQPTVASKVEETYYGLKVAYLFDNSKWAYGTDAEIAIANNEYHKNYLWLEDMNFIKKFIILSFDEIDCLNYIAEEKSEKCNTLIKRILGNRLDDAVQYLSSKTPNRLAVYDGRIIESEKVLGLPAGLKGFRIDY